MKSLKSCLKLGKSLKSNRQIITKNQNEIKQSWYIDCLTMGFIRNHLTEPPIHTEDDIWPKVKEREYGIQILTEKCQITNN